MRSIVIWSNSLDTSADRVEQQLLRVGQAPFRVDIDRYGDGFRLSSLANEAVIHGPRGSAPLKQVGAVYYRRPYLNELPHDSRDFTAHEAWYFAKCALLQAAQARWMNLPSAVQLAENKLLQLEVAEEVGLPVPPTALVATPQEALDFYRSCNEECICKPGFAGTISKPEPMAVYAWALESGLRLDDFASVRLAPTVLQKRVRKLADIRLTQVGGNSLAVRVVSPDGTVDWRRLLNGQELSYEAVEVPDNVLSGILKLMQRLQLSYGALDFAEDTEGNWVFLEINPAGQWEWLEDEADVPIAATIAEWLAEV